MNLTTSSRFTSFAIVAYFSALKLRIFPNLLGIRIYAQVVFDHILEDPSHVWVALGEHILMLDDESY